MQKSLLKSKIDSIQVHSASDMLCLLQFRDYFIDDEQGLGNWDTAEDLIGNLWDEVHASGYDPEGDTPRNECDYQISEQELGSFILKYIPEYPTSH